MRKIVKIEVHHEALLSILKLPKDTQILCVEQGGDDRLQRKFCIFFESPEVAEVPEGSKVPIGKCIIQHTYCEHHGVSFITESHLENY